MAFYEWLKTVWAKWWVNNSKFRLKGGEKDDDIKALKDDDDVHRAFAKYKKLNDVLTTSWGVC